MTTAHQGSAFSASKIAQVLGLQLNAVHGFLVGAPHTRLVKEDGKERSAWAVAAMPARLRELLEREAAGLSYSSTEAMLVNVSPEWATVPRPDREAAARLCRALRKPMQLRESLLPAALVKLGLEEFKAVHGYAISEATWWKRFQAVVSRDGGAGRFDRLHLYLREAAPAQVRPIAPELEALHSRLKPDLAGIKDNSCPTPEEEALITFAALQHFDLVRSTPGMAEGQILSSLAGCLVNAIPGLVRAGKPDLYRRKLKRILRRWDAGERTVEACQDGRVNSGRLPYACPPCGKVLHDWTVIHGHKSFAWREAVKRGLLCESCRSRYGSYDIRRSKSAVPRAFMSQYEPNDLTVASFRSKREAKLVGPHPRRIYQGVLNPGDVFVMDDMTSNERVAVPLPGRRWEFYKVQIIAASDMASAKALDFVIHFGHPLAWSVRTLQGNLYTSDAIGMPRLGQYFEKGVFKAKLVTETAAKDEIPWAETAALLASRLPFRIADSEDPILGAESTADTRETFSNLRITHANLPMAKTIEGDFLIIQRHAKALPGHLGFNERFGKFDRLQAFMDRCRAGKEDPREEGILTIDGLRDAFRQIMETYNAEPNGGARCRGNSPDEVWGEYVPTHPLEKIPAHLGYLFSSRSKEAKVTEAGIIIRDNAIDPHQPQVYYGHPRLGELIGQKVSVRYNPHRPKVLWVQIKQEDWFSVERQTMPAWGATKADHQKDQRARWNHMAHSTMMAGQVRHPSGATIEREDHFPDAQHDLGAEMAEAEAADNRKANDDAGQISRLRRQGLAAGVKPVRNLNTAQGQQAQRLLIAARKMRKEEVLDDPSN